MNVYLESLTHLRSHLWLLYSHMNSDGCATDIYHDWSSSFKAPWFQHPHSSVCVCTKSVCKALYRQPYCYEVDVLKRQKWNEQPVKNDTEWQWSKKILNLHSHFLMVYFFSSHFSFKWKTKQKTFLSKKQNTQLIPTAFTSTSRPTFVTPPWPEMHHPLITKQKLLLIFSLTPLNWTKTVVFNLSGTRGRWPGGPCEQQQSWKQAVSHHSSQQMSTPATQEGSMEPELYARSPPHWPKALRGKFRSLYRKGKQFFTKAFHNENTHTPEKQMPHITNTEPIYRHGAVDIKAVCSLWGIPPFSSFKRELKFIFILYTPPLIECVHARE